jgi:hypothetical protein
MAWQKKCEEASQGQGHWIRHWRLMAKVSIHAVPFLNLRICPQRHEVSRVVQIVRSCVGHSLRENRPHLRRCALIRYAMYNRI